MKYITRSILNRRIIIYICLEKDQNVMCVVYDAERDAFLCDTCCKISLSTHLFPFIFNSYDVWEVYVFSVFSSSIFHMYVYLVS